MSIKDNFQDRLSRLIFLEMKKERMESIFMSKIKEEEIYIPIAADDIIKKVSNGEDVNSIPIAFFIEGMVYVLGIDEKFKYNQVYKELIKNSSKAIKFIKGKIAENVKCKKYQDAYILLKGLLQLEETTEIYNKLLMLLETIRVSDKMYIEEELNIIQRAKTLENYPTPYLYESIIKKEKGDYEDALFSINTYISKGGEETLEISDLKNSLKIITKYKKAKNMVYKDPEKALKILIPLSKDMGDNAQTYYYIGLAYRKLENYKKAIYYLEKSMEIDNSYPEVLNEIGINYACLEDFQKAVLYLRKVFEVTKSVEVCTNLIMCYINIRDYKQAKIHLEIAKKIDKEDEIVKQLDKILKDV